MERRGAGVDGTLTRMIVDAPSPHTLVATVGTSPVPVLLSIRTLKPGRVVLVHSEATKVYAERIAELVDPRIEVKYVSCGVGDDFVNTSERMRNGLREFRPFVLDYSGGTSAMVACATLVHLELHGDLGGVRWSV